MTYFMLVMHVDTTHTVIFNFTFCTALMVMLFAPGNIRRLSQLESLSDK